MMYLVKNRIITLDKIHVSEPFLPAFCEGLDSLEETAGEQYAFANRHRISSRPFPDPEIPSASIDFIYANNVLHSFGYKSLGEELETKLYAEYSIGDPQRIAHINQPAEQKVKEVLYDASRILRQGGIFFGRNLADYINEPALIALREKKDKTKDDAFAVWTAEAVMDGTLIGLSPKSFCSWAKEAGFSKVYTEPEPPDKVKPRINFFFRFEK